MVFSRSTRIRGISALFALSIAVSSGYSQAGCCITSIKDSLVNALSETQGIGSVTVQPGAACDTFAISWSAYDPGMGHYMPCCILTYKLIGNNVRWSQMSDGITASGTLPGWCQVNIEKGSLQSNRSAAFTASPNPFQSQVNLHFENTMGKAVFQVFDIRGTKLYEQMVGKSTKVVWKPTNLRQGIYLAKIKTESHVYFQNIICLR